MKTIRRILFVVSTPILLSWIIVSCTKKDELTVITKSITEITTNSAKSGGKVTASGNIAVEISGICWSENPSPTTNDYFTTDIQGAGEYISTMKNLKSSTTYYVRAYATTGSIVMYGDELSFTTTTEGGGNSGGGNGGGGNGGGTNTFSVSTHGVTQITATTAQCGGVVTCNGDVTITARGVCWSTSPNPTIAQAHTTDGQGVGSFTSTLTGLSANTKYYVKAYAQSTSETVYGTEMSFNTTNEQPPQSPTVTITVINVSPTYLELKFEPSPNTSYYCYNIGETLTSTTHHTGFETKKFTSFQSQYFQPDTEYEFTIVAYDANGIAGEIIHPKFRTNPAPYSNYYRVYDDFYQLGYAKLRNQPSGNANHRFKEIILWSNTGYWVHFETLVYSYQTDNIWSSGVYTIGTTGGSVGIGEYICNVYKNASIVGVNQGSTFTISKSGNTYTYDLYGDNGSITAHFTGIPTE